MAEVSTVILDALPGFNEELIDYIISSIENLEIDQRKSPKSLEEILSPFLLETGFSKSEFDATEKCRMIAKAFGGSGMNKISPQLDESPIVLQKAVKVSEDANTLKQTKEIFQTLILSDNSPFDEDGNVKVGTHFSNTQIEFSTIPTTQKQLRKQRKENEQIKRHLQAEEQSRLQEREDLARARMAAIKASRTGGRQSSLPISLDRFSLPHPSGTGELLTDASLTLIPGRRYGLIGKNGIGKSTLMKYLSSYQLSQLQQHRILLVDQHIEGDEETPLQWVLRADVERTALIEEERRLSFYLHGPTTSSSSSSSFTPASSPSEFASSSSTNLDSCSSTPPTSLSSSINNNISSKEKNNKTKKTLEKKSSSSTSTSSTSTTSSICTPSTSSPSSPSSPSPYPYPLELPPDLQDINLELALQEIYDRMDKISLSTSEMRAKNILSRFGFTINQMNEMKTKDLSGGWRVRAALSAAIFVSPDVLLLDEPTNHLDLSALIWLENFLTGGGGGGAAGGVGGVGAFSGICMIVSHDHCFLDNVCTDILEIKQKSSSSSSSSSKLTNISSSVSVRENKISAKLETFAGDYRSYLISLHEKMVSKNRIRENYIREKEKLIEFIAKEGKKYDNPQHQAQKAMKLKQLEKLIEKEKEDLGSSEDDDYDVGSGGSGGGGGGGGGGGSLKGKGKIQSFKTLTQNNSSSNSSSSSSSTRSHHLRFPRPYSRFSSSSSQLLIRLDKVSFSYPLLTPPSTTSSPPTSSLSTALSASTSSTSSSSSSSSSSSLFSDVDFMIGYGDTIILLGDNGIGKSTFLSLLSGEIHPTSGSLTRSPGSRLAYLPQHLIGDGVLNPLLSPLEMIRNLPQDETTGSCVGGQSGISLGSRQEETAHRNYLATFGINNWKTMIPSRLLSGGQRVRVGLSISLHRKPDILLLDEPTNHLDTESEEDLIHAILNYEGAVVAVTHDESFISRLMRESDPTGGTSIHSLLHQLNNPSSSSSSSSSTTPSSASSSSSSSSFGEDIETPSSSSSSSSSSFPKRKKAQLWVLQDQKIRRFEGNFQEYKRYVTRKLLRQETSSSS